MNYHILDTETASLKGGVCEIAWLEVDKDLNIVSEFCTLVNPEVPIEEGAMSIHGITEDDVRGKPTLAEVASCFSGPIQMVGHNSSFDKRMLKDAIQIETLICTLKLAREYIKNTTNHKLEVLQKELNLPVQDSHSALGDVHTCRDLLLYLREKHGVTLEEAAVRQDLDFAAGEGLPVQHGLLDPPVARFRHADQPGCVCSTWPIRNTSFRRCA